jgi:hypothetical protein
VLSHLYHKLDILYTSIFIIFLIIPFKPCCLLCYAFKRHMFNLITHGLMNEMDMRHCVVSSVSFDILSMYLFIIWLVQIDIFNYHFNVIHGVMNKMVYVPVCCLVCIVSLVLYTYLSFIWLFLSNLAACCAMLLISPSPRCLMVKTFWLLSHTYQPFSHIFFLSSYHFLVVFESSSLTILSLIVVLTSNISTYIVNK